MKFIPDEDAAAWLSDFIPDSDNFDWDEGNMLKTFKHGIPPGEVESIFWQRTFLFAGKIVEPLHDEWRGLILGRTNNGKLVSLIFTRRGEKLRPISCRAMRRVERRLYEETI